MKKDILMKFQVGDMVVYQPTKQAASFLYLVVDKTRRNYILLSLTTGDKYPVDIKYSCDYMKVS